MDYITWLVTLNFIGLAWILKGTDGRDCDDISGSWYNQLGSEMILNTETDGTIVGQYRTSVGKVKGSAGKKTQATIKGLAPFPYNPTGSQGPVFGFSVLWNDGNSTTAWTAQCLTCGGRERIVTSWILRSKVDNCADKWKSVMVGRDYFTRSDDMSRRSRLRTRNISRMSQRGGLFGHGRKKRSTEHLPVEKEEDPVLLELVPPDIDASLKVAGTKEPIDVKVDIDVDEPVPETLAFAQGGQEEIINDVPREITINGKWYNELGSEAHLYHDDAFTITGSYQTTMERLQHGKRKHTEILGVAGQNHDATTVSLLLSWNNGTSVTAWVGQVHICIQEGRPVEVLETAFLHRTRVDHCLAEWKSTLHGHNTFTRQDPFHSRERIIALNEFGEEEERC